MKNKKAKAVILSNKAKKPLKDLIKKLNIDIIDSCNLSMDYRIKDHVDLQIHKLSNNTYVCPPSLYEYYRNKLKKYGSDLLIGVSEPKENYPNDCPYNVVATNTYYISKKNIVDKAIKDFYDSKGLLEIHVKQGYIKCMSIEIKGHIITCDMGIYKVLKDNNKSVFYISSDGISLDGFNGGFLGGSCGIIDEDMILFTGDIRRLKDYQKLEKILNKLGLKPIYPQGEDIVDLGSIIPIY